MHPRPTAVPPPLTQLLQLQVVQTRWRWLLPQGKASTHPVPVPFSALAEAGGGLREHLWAGEPHRKGGV